MERDEDEVKSYPGPGEGEYSTIFSGKGDPEDDPGHGHVIVTSEGEVVYAREMDSQGGEEGLEDDEEGDLSDGSDHEGDDGDDE